jgi:hypothetical protein
MAARTDHGVVERHRPAVRVGAGTRARLGWRFGSSVQIRSRDA